MTELCELSSISNGASIIFATNDYFGVAENLLKDTEPTEKGIEEMSDEQMTVTVDAWVTERKRTPGYDFAIIKLAARAEIHFICVDTAFLVDNVALQFSVQAKLLTADYDSPYFRGFRYNKLGQHATADEWSNIQHFHSETWPCLISLQSLNPGHSSMNKKVFKITMNGEDVTHLRLNIFPDGGITRLRVYGEVLEPLTPTYPLSSSNWSLDLVSKIYGGNCIAYSSCCIHTHPNNLIKPAEPTNEEDGWHTARSFLRSNIWFPGRMCGEEWAIFQLGYYGKIASIIIDTTYCIGNAPYAVQVQGISEKNSSTILLDTPSWKNIISYTTVNAGCQQVIAAQNYQDTTMVYVKLLIKPDGCISRFRVFGGI
ncbi:unnamed protein product [Lasius platythorax]|uniref:Allantoate amidinohydrolase n=1 Tax=Lasius platythorax TaxID=488582 RepID=A0AAV2N169_9HYME